MSGIRNSKKESLIMPTQTSRQTSRTMRKPHPLAPPAHTSKARRDAWAGKVPFCARVRVFMLADHRIVGEGEYGGQEPKLEESLRIAEADHITVFGQRDTNHLPARHRSTLSHAKIILDSGETIFDDDQTETGMNKYYWKVIGTH
jgi:hypothetical protein